MMNKYKEVAGYVIGWANDRNLIKGSTASNQFIKLVEEVQEIKNAENDDELLKEVGDYHIVSLIMLEQLGFKDSLDKRASYPSDDWIDILGDIGSALSKKKPTVESVIIAGMSNVNQFLPENKTPADALEAAFNKIKDRKGKMIDGVFVKESDL